MENSPQQPVPYLGVFHVSCWVLGLIAFVQVMSIGVALAMRSQSPVVERVVTEYVSVPQPISVVAAPSESLKGHRDVSAEPIVRVDWKQELAAMSSPEVLRTSPIIADPITERLVNDAREARIRSDHMVAITKLDEALHRDPENPVVLYEMGANFEVMGIYDKATDQYMAVYRLGPLKAGSLFRKAGAKLERGIVPEVKGLTSLGVVRLSTSEVTAQGTRCAVVLPVSVALGQDFDASLLETKVHFFEKQKGEVKQVVQPEAQGFRWLSEPIDWKDGEELVEVWYHIPHPDLQQRHLFGDREFYGYVAELYYESDLVDLRAHPRPLIQKIHQRGHHDLFDSGWDPELDPLLETFEDYEAGDSLLPKLPSR